ncbi:NLR family CARD domain-containing protein 3-like [Acropora muricata]|uniref:NLR family CARD domain-containing protein 3-like n=1 Tax=Acropora muricata TaxID=159855 RepID=UPI0034E51151
MMMASNVCSLQEHDASYGSSKLQVTILASEWGSSKGGLSTLNRELAIQLAKFSCIEVTFFLPKCSDKDKEAADSHGISVLEAKRRPGYDELDWLSFPPEHLKIDVVVGHGVKLGRQAQVIRDSHKCKWVQIVHTDPEELGMFKCYENPISTGEKKHHIEVELCQMADFVVGVGPKLAEAFRKYLGFCKKHEDVFELTPGVFEDFSSVQQVPDERRECSVLVFGRGDLEDFKLKGFDIAAKSVADLSETVLVFVGAPHGKHEEIAKRLVEFGIPEKRLRVRGYMEREALKQLFCEVDLVLMPSRTEGFGLTGLEVLSAGLPVIISKNSGFGQALGSVPFGSFFVIDSEDASAWPRTTEGILKKDRKLRLHEVKALRGFYSERYSWSKQCKGLIEKMVTLVDGTSSEPEITAQAIEAKEQKGNEDLIGIQGLCSCVPPKRKRGIEKNETEQPAGLSSCVPSKRKRGIERNETEQPAARTSCPNHVIEWIRGVGEKREGVIVPVPWCEEFSFQIKDIFTRLRIVEKEKTGGMVTSKEVTSMTSIFAPHEGCEQPLIVLIEGEPGMGKTTYCQKLVFEWASKQCHEWDESFPRIDVLLLLRCREIKSTLWDAIEDQILPKGIEPEERKLFFQFLKENPSKLLIVLDGLDEADPQTLEMCLKLIQREQLRGCYIVVTSRHEAGKKVRPYTDTLLEIVGFTMTDAERYIRKYFQHKEHLAEKLISKLTVDKDLKELTQNPLNTLLLCVIFEDLEGVLPSNRSQLYVEIVLFILRRYESKNGLSNRGKDLLLVYNKELMILGETALDSLHKQELYFDDHKGDIKESLLMKFGFLSIQSGGSKRAPCDRYGFFHKSFQEFFSGYFLAFSIIDDVTNLHSVLTDRRYMGELFQVFKYMSAIIAQQPEETAMSIVQGIASIENETGPASHRFYPKVAHYLMNECKTYSGELCTKLVRTFGESLELVDVVVGYSYDKCDREVFGTFLQALTFNSTISKLKFLNLQFFSKAANLLAQALRVNTTLSSLDLGCNYIDAEGATLLAEVLRVNTSLFSLNLGSNSFDNEGANSLAQGLKVNTSLSSLELYSNSIGAKGANSLAEALRVNSSLSSLNLSRNSIGAKGANSLAEALKVNSFLSSLNLSWNSIGARGANSLAEALRVNNSLSSLDLVENSIGARGATSLAQALRVNTFLSSLNLYSNSIGDEGANSLAEALTVNTSLSSLCLMSNSIGDKGLKSLPEALTVNTSLSSLDLGTNSIGDDGAYSLAKALRVSTSLTSLNLYSNCIDEEGADSLAQALGENNSLSSLDISCNSIGEMGADSLAQALGVNTSLSSLNLSLNSIGTEGAISLAQALKGNASLSSLNLSGNSIGNEGANSFAQALRVNTSLSTLDLHFNCIRAEGANSLAQALRENTSLSSLDLQTNRIGAEGANAFAQALRVNTSLSLLDLRSTSISSEGANSLDHCIRENPFRSSLDFRFGFL